jgi:hypothetical protein
MTTAAQDRIRNLGEKSNRAEGCTRRVLCQSREAAYLFYHVPDFET